jgi:hypothetical protein
MKKILNVLLIALVLIACNKEVNEIDNEVTNPYKLPWKTEYIHYENLSMCRGSHSSGYKLYYKDSLLMEDCIEFGGIRISNSLLINDSILHLFFTGSNGSYDLMTKNGGLSWEKFPLGPPDIYNIHFVNMELIYCVTKNQNDLYFTGIGESNLSIYKDTLSKGTHYIFDSGTNIIDIDSTLITLNDSVYFVIKFKE